MTYWIRWRAADGGEGPRIGLFDHRQEAERHIQDKLRRWAAELEHVAGTPGVWTSSGQLYRGDLLDETPLGAFIIEREPGDAPEEPER